MSSGQRKRRGGALDSRRPRKRTRPTASTSARTTEAEAIELGESAPEEALDLPGPSSNPAAIRVTPDDSDETDEEEAPAEVRSLSSESAVPEVIDLTQDDSDESDAEDDSSDAEVPVLTRPPGTIRCPICMDFYSEIMQNGRQIVSTLCGHVFCNRCLRYSLMNTSHCPTCRADTGGLYHPLYI